MSKMIHHALFFLPLLGLCLATPLELKPLSDEEISYINSVQSSWKAGRNFHPEDLERFKGYPGVEIQAEKLKFDMSSIQRSNAVVRDDLPKEFDSRKKWPQCKSLNEIRDQGTCSWGDWALITAAAITDRICIHTNKSVHISAEDITACVTPGGRGCNGGFPEAAWQYYVDKGVVSGGNYNSSEGCMPYSIPKCDHYDIKGKYKPCKGISPSPVCAKECRQGYNKTYEQDKHYGQPFKHFPTVEAMMQEIVDNGPLITGFMMYSDFLSYKSGIYKHTTQKYMGGHTLKIIGYGEENGEKYWLVANTWNEDWGEKGFGRIARGVNECGIEDQALAGLPKE